MKEMETQEMLILAENGMKDTEKKMMISHGGINWCWFTECTYNSLTDQVTVHRHFRLHKFDYRGDGLPWPKECEEAISGDSWRSYKESEDGHRTAVEFYLPDLGYKKISNPRNIFAY
jgi:hypothetical protein